MVGVSVALPSAPRASRFVLDGPALKEAVALGLAAAVGFVTIVGVVTDAIDVPFFVRRTPLLAVDYPIWALNALLLGFLVGLGHYARRMRVGLGSGAVYGGGFLAAFAVSCPACNGLLLAALGSSGVAAYVEPVRPFIGGVTALFLAWLLVRRVRAVRAGCTACALPAAAPLGSP